MYQSYFIQTIYTIHPTYFIHQIHPIYIQFAKTYPIYKFKPWLYPSYSAYPIQLIYPVNDFPKPSESPEAPEVLEAPESPEAPGAPIAPEAPEALGAPGKKLKIPKPR